MCLSFFRFLTVAVYSSSMQLPFKIEIYFLACVKGGLLYSLVVAA